eukprot:SAG31_NODE_3283_length_4466_cov_1.746279_2_plen_155_part_00
MGTYVYTMVEILTHVSVWPDHHQQQALALSRCLQRRPPVLTKFSSARRRSILRSGALPKIGPPRRASREGSVSMSDATGTKRPRSDEPAEPSNPHGESMDEMAVVRPVKAYKNQRCGNSAWTFAGLRRRQLRCPGLKFGTPTTLEFSILLVSLF